MPAARSRLHGLLAVHARLFCSMCSLLFAVLPTVLHSGAACRSISSRLYAHICLFCLCLCLSFRLYPFIHEPVNFPSDSVRQLEARCTCSWGIDAASRSADCPPAPPACRLHRSARYRFEDGRAALFIAPASLPELIGGCAVCFAELHPAISSTRLHRPAPRGLPRIPSCYARCAE